MGDFLERNLSLLKRRQPKLAAYLRSFSECSVEERAHPVGRENLRIERKTPPAENASGVRKKTGLPVAVLHGVGSPACYYALLLELPQNVRFIVALETKIDLIRALFRELPLFETKPQRNLVFVVSEELPLIDEAVRSAFASKGFLVGKHSFSVFSADGNNSDEEAVKSLATAFEQRLDYYIDIMGNSAEDSLLGLRQMALSSPWTLYGARLEGLRNAFAGRSAIIVSAGPSLDKNIHLLPDIQEDYVIIAVDTIVEKLMSRGVKPHFVCVLERGYALYLQCFRQLYSRWRHELADVILVPQSVCTPQIAGRWPGPVAVVGKRDINLEQAIIGGLMGGTVLPSGASVSHMALGLAGFLGVDSVALVGQDLAYGDSGESHATEYTFLGQETYESGIAEKERLSIPGIDGGLVRTNHWWKYFRDLFASMIPTLGIPVHDCTEGGAFIPGTRVEPLRSFLAEHRSTGSTREIRKTALSLVKRPEHAARHPQFDVAYATLQQMFHGSDEETERILLRMEMSSRPTVPDGMLQDIVREVLGTFNRIISANPYLSFLLQSQIGRIIAKTCVDPKPVGLTETRQWLGEYRLFFEDARTVAQSAEGWFMYIDGVRQLGPEVRRILSSPSDASEEDICVLCGGKQESFRDAITTDIFFSRTDGVERGWSAKCLQLLSRHFAAEKRFTEASDMLEEAVNMAEKNATGTEEMVTLLLDAIGCLLSRDLCRRPEVSKARRMLAKAHRLSPNEPKLLPYARRLVQAKLSMLKDMGTLANPDTIRMFLSLDAQLSSCPERVLKLLCAQREEPVSTTGGVQS